MNDHRLALSGASLRMYDSTTREEVWPEPVALDIKTQAAPALDMTDGDELLRFTSSGIATLTRSGADGRDLWSVTWMPDKTRSQVFAPPAVQLQSNGRVLASSQIGVFGYCH